MKTDFSLPQGSHKHPNKPSCTNTQQVWRYKKARYCFSTSTSTSTSCYGHSHSFQWNWRQFEWSLFSDPLPQSLTLHRQRFLYWWKRNLTCLSGHLGPADLNFDDPPAVLYHLHDKEKPSKGTGHPSVHLWGHSCSTFVITALPSATSWAIN